MKNNEVKKLYSALSVLKKEFGKTKCKEKCASCIQCWIDISIIQLEAIVNLVDETKWKIPELKTYLRKQGLPSLAKVFDKVKKLK